MTWILTATGRRIDLDCPMPHRIELMDVAWSLAQQVRFVGHALRPYSVAEHSLLVSEIVEREVQGAGPTVQLYALLHDAHEYVTGDLPTPAKHVIGPAWPGFERRWEHAVHKRFGLLSTAAVWQQAVKHADLRALATERRDLMPQHGDEWAVLTGVEPLPWLQLYTPERRAADWEFWRDRFLDRFHELKEAIAARQPTSPT
jgi:hypothetical protein